MSQIDSQLRELLDRAVGEPPRHIAVPAVRRRFIHRRVTQTALAAVAVAAVGVAGSVVAAHFTATGGALAGAAGHGAPQYYLQVDGRPGNQLRVNVQQLTAGRPPVMTLQDALVVRSTATGAVTGRIRCPEGAGWWVDQAAIAPVTASSFLVGCMEQPGATKPDVDTSAEVLFRVRLTAAGQLAAMSPVRGGHFTHVGAGIVSMAATPDGREVAVLLNPGTGRMNIEVLNTVTGELGRWRGLLIYDYWGLSLTRDGQELVFTGAPCLGVGRCTAPAKIMAVRPASQGGSLAGARIIAQVSTRSAAAVSPDGSTVAVLTAGRGNTLTVRRIAASTGRPLRTLYTASGTGPADVGFLAADPSGRYLLVNGTLSGRPVNGWIRAGRVAALPPASNGIKMEAW